MLNNDATIKDVDEALVSVWGRHSVSPSEISMNGATLIEAMKRHGITPLVDHQGYPLDPREAYSISNQGIFLIKQQEQ